MSDFAFSVDGLGMLYHVGALLYRHNTLRGTINRLFQTVKPECV
jgi:hypothetical protein